MRGRAAALGGINDLRGSTLTPPRPHSGPTPRIRVLIADDDEAARVGLEGLVRDEADATVVASVASGPAAVEAIRRERPDVVFLDVQMPGRTGLEVVRTIGPEAMPATVFVTATEEHAVEAFEVAATDYLVKPVDRERFAQSFERVRHRLELERMSGLRERILDALGAPAAADEGLADRQPSTDDRAPSLDDLPPATDDRYLERIAVELKGKVRVVLVSELDYVVASGPYAELYAGDRRHVIRASMRTLERRLDPEKFVRIHRSTIVRLDLVDTLLKGRGGEYEVLLKTGARLRVSRARRDALERRLGVVR